MTLELTEQQHKALTQVSRSPVSVIDRATNTSYVLVRAEVYQRIQSLLDEDAVSSMEPLLAELCPEDWEDADNYEDRR